MTSDLVPLWLKVAYAVFLAIMIPVYAWKAAAGVRNFLWFSDIALFGTVAALWLESPLIASMMGVAVLLPELVWNLSLVSRLLFGRGVTGIADYMFDPREYWYMRALSLFHVHMPITLVWLIWRLGYDTRALVAQTFLAWIVLPLTYALTAPRFNINRVFGPGTQPQRRVHPLIYLFLLMLIGPLIVYVPTHLILDGIFGR
jgi:hypothetical protein